MRIYLRVDQYWEKDALQQLLNLRYEIKYNALCKLEDNANKKLKAYIKNEEELKKKAEYLAYLEEQNEMYWKDEEADLQQRKQNYKTKIEDKLKNIDEQKKQASLALQKAIDLQTDVKHQKMQLELIKDEVVSTVKELDVCVDTLVALKEYFAKQNITNKETADIVQKFIEKTKALTNRYKQLPEQKAAIKDSIEVFAQKEVEMSILKNRLQKQQEEIKQERLKLDEDLKKYNKDKAAFEYEAKKLQKENESLQYELDRLRLATKCYNNKRLLNKIEKRINYDTYIQQQITPIENKKVMNNILQKAYRNCDKTSY